MTIHYLREKLQAKSRAIKTLDYAMSGPGGVTICEAFVEAQGLKTLFTEFMGKVSNAITSRRTLNS